MTKALKQKVIIDVERWKQKRKREKRERFARIYDKKKTVEFKSKDELNMNKHFFMPTLTEGFNFKGSRNAQILYPVLCSQANFRQMEYFQISRENIAQLAGISTVAVDDAINVLENLQFNDFRIDIKTPLLSRKKVQDGKRRYWTYLPGFFRPDVPGLKIDEWKGKYLVFHTCIIDSGIWAELSRNAKALYLSMRSVSRFDRELYFDLENIYVPDFAEMYIDGDEPGKELFKARKWEICDRPLTELFELADIPYSNIKQLTAELEQYGLVERLHDTKSVFQVWLKPRKIKKNYS